MKITIPRVEEAYGNDVFEILLEYEVSRCQRYPAALSLLQIEMTPSALDEASLSNASKIFTAKINAHIRSVDIPTITGNRLKLLFPNTDETGAQIICERLLSIFKNKINGTVAFSLQIGACSHSGGQSLTSQHLLQKSGEALSQSKLKGPHTYVMITE